MKKFNEINEKFKDSQKTVFLLLKGTKINLRTTPAEKLPPDERRRLVEAGLGEKDENCNNMQHFSLFLLC